VSGTGELLGLVDLHITELNLDFLRTQRLDQGNLVGMVSSYTLADGQVREMADVWFRQENTPAAAPPPNLTELLVAPGAIGPALTDPGPQGPPAPAPVLPVPAAGPADDEDAAVVWGVGSDDVSVFHNIDHETERARLDACQRWQRLKFDAGYAMLNWPVELGGRALPSTYIRAYLSEESKFEIPSAGELPPTSMGLIATTIALPGCVRERCSKWAM
jgi:hypothetical protein